MIQFLTLMQVNEFQTKQVEVEGIVVVVGNAYDLISSLLHRVEVCNCFE